MSRYIDADALIEKFDKIFLGNNPRGVIRVTIENAPTADVMPKEKYDRLLENATILAKAVRKYQTADVVEVVHGYWKGKPIAGYCTVRCSVCGSAFLDNDGRWNYCPHCGADMRGENDGE